jgi:SAM-dependent methyltransferase
LRPPATHTSARRECETYPFDALAEDYDASFTDTTVGRLLREAVWRRIDAELRCCGSILDLGCGTGADALRLAGRGATVVGIDASPRMIEVARRKVSPSAAGGRAEFHCVPMEALGSALGGQYFDAALSNFGAINCVRDVPALAATIARRIVPGGKLLWVVMGRYVPWEWLWYLAHGEPRKAGRRLRPQGVTWRGLAVSYPTPSDLARVLRPWFQIERVSPLGCVLPPSYAAAWLETRPRALRLLAGLEQLAQRCGWLAGISDHFIVSATRRHDPTSEREGVQLQAH